MPVIKFGKLSKGGGMLNTKLSFFIPISKLDADERMVYGVATCETLDKQNEVVDYGATKEALIDYSNWRNIREMHSPSAVGVAPILELRDNTKELYIGAKIVDDAAWAKCKEGVYKGFSIGGQVLDRKIELSKTTGKAVNRVTKYVMNEISVVDRPANPSCTFQTVKRDVSIETVTVTDDPLVQESARVMEKAILLSKKVLSKAELEALPDSSFGLIKVVSDGDKLIKHRLYPIPDRIHAINMIRKMVGDDLSDDLKDKVHDAAKIVLGKKHIETECPYCVKQKLEGGVEMGKDITKNIVVAEVKSDVVPAEKEKEVVANKPAVVPPVAGAPVVPAVPSTPIAGEQPVEKKPFVAEEEPTESAVAPAAGEGAVGVEAKLDQLISMLSELLSVEQNEDKGVGQDDTGNESAYMDEGKIPEEETVPAEESAGTIPDEGVASPVAEMKPVGKEPAACACSKVEKVATPKLSLDKILSKKINAIIEPLQKENAELKAKLEKFNKQPLPRKEIGMTKAEGAQKVDKYQDVRLEKNEVEFEEELQKDITKAIDLRKSGKALNSDEQTFCQRVADKMLAVKAAKK